jgi:hypothetical protein
LLVFLGEAGRLLPEAGVAPDLLAEGLGEAVLKLADASGQAGRALVDG